MRIVDLIQSKRDGTEFSKEEVEFFLQGFLKGEIPDYQAAALLMSVFFVGLSDSEIVDWTENMLRAAPQLDLGEIPQPKIDKQSTGGVGDKTSLIVGPLVAAAGITVPMIAGRSSAYTGGTLDKIQSIPGFNAFLSAKEFKAVLGHAGIAMISPSEEMTPAVMKMAPLREATATVESIPLMIASILSRKFVEGIDGLVLDVKTGAGSLISKMTESRRLAQSLLNVSKRMNKKALCVISDMDQPLGYAIGNALEVMEAVETMRGNGPTDVVELSLELAARMVCLAYPERTLEDAKEQVFKLLSDGSALRKFKQMIEVQGGNPAAIDSFELLPTASAEFVISSPRAGYVSRISADDIGQATMYLGAGRQNLKSEIDFAVGIVLEHKVGDRVEAGERLCSIYYNDGTHLEEASQMVEDAFHISATQPETRPLIYEVLQ